MEGAWVGNVQDTTLFSFWSSVKSEIDDDNDNLGGPSVDGTAGGPSVDSTAGGPSVDSTAGGPSVNGTENGTASGSDHGTGEGPSDEGPSDGGSGEDLGKRFSYCAIFKRVSCFNCF